MACITGKGLPSALERGMAQVIFLPRVKGIMELSKKAHNPLSCPLTAIRGVGPKMSNALAQAGLRDIFELLLQVPKSVVEEFDCPGFAFMEAGRVYVAKGRVVASKITGMGHKKRLEAILQDDSGRLRVIFFGPAVNYAQILLKTDAEISVIGEAKNFLGRMQMVHPKLVSNSQENIIASNKAQYSKIGGIDRKIFKSVIDKALSLLDESDLKEHLPNDFLVKQKLSPLKNAFFSVHFKDENKADWDERANDPNFMRLAFEELLAFYVPMIKERRMKHLPKGMKFSKINSCQFSEGLLPFKLTDAQLRALNEIFEDMDKESAMSRLLQGDVGSGKTAVSALSALHVVLQGAQVAVMAPTEILAEQLFEVFKTLLAKKNVTCALITASTKSKERKVITENIKKGEIEIVIGTHALLSDDVVFKSLGLVIIDEQHRFGVEQRSSLLSQMGARQGFTPHLLVMSATPIPRSLALTLHGDLELSVIDEKPRGRQPISTKILRGPPLDSLSRLAMRIIDTKQKAFIVFPLVLESEHFDLENATKASLLLKEQFGAHTTLLLHGKMSSQEKQEAMLSFKRGDATFLVSTTVVEVGVDIPDATCMVIVNAERFGLAQLHQLRGRVGRGSNASYCFLLSDIKNPQSTAYKRLDALCQTEDGFKLAKIDLDIRGPGELLGTKQAGLPNFSIFNHSDFGRLVEPAKRMANIIVEQQNDECVSHLFLRNEAHFS